MTVLERWGNGVSPWVRGREFTPLIKGRQDGGPFLLETEFAISELGNEAQGLFNEFLENPEFERSVKAIEQFLTEQPKEKYKELRGRVAGFIFECLAFNFLKRTISSNEVILSPMEVAELYRRVFPEKPIISEDFHLAIKGITLPDGILMKGNQKETFIIGLFEYSLSAKPAPGKELQHKHDLNQQWVTKDLFPFGNTLLPQFLGQYIHSKYPNLPPKLSVNLQDLKITFIFPTNENVQKQTGDIPKGQVILLPFSSGEFRGILDGIFAILGILRLNPKDNFLVFLPTLCYNSFIITHIRLS